MSEDGVPAYESMLEAYHRAFAPELQRMVADLPLCVGDRALDVGCGDGFYTCLLGKLVAPSGSATGVDLLPSYLTLALRRAQHQGVDRFVSFKQGNIRRLPFRSAAFDVVWCAQSLFSLPNAPQALTEMTRVARPGGVVAILEDDTLHQVLIPLPAELEMELRLAEWRAFTKARKSANRYYIARHLRSLLAKAGLRPQRRRTYALHREFPIGQAERDFLNLYLQDLRDRALPHLPRHLRRDADALLTPGHKRYVVDQDHFSVTCLDHVLWGKKP